MYVCRTFVTSVYIRICVTSMYIRKCVGGGGEAGVQFLEGLFLR